MTRLGELTTEQAATEAAGNWQEFTCFIWFRASDLDSPDDWAVFYTHNRDSGLLDQSNAAQIGKALQRFTEGDDPDVVFESHHHWAVGHVDGFSLCVFRNGEITEAFRTYHELAERMADYPVLDETDYSNREYEATLENVSEAAWRLKQNFELPDGWQSEVFNWFWDHDQSAVENTDDQGGWPDESQLETAFEALGYEKAA